MPRPSTFLHLPAYKAAQTLLISIQERLHLLEKPQIIAGKSTLIKTSTKILALIAKGTQTHGLDEAGRTVQWQRYRTKAHGEALALESHLFAYGLLLNRADGLALLDQVRDLQDLLLPPTK